MSRMLMQCPQTFLHPDEGLNPKRLYDTVKYKIEFNKKNPNYFKPSGTLIFCGSQGEGKTLSAVDYNLNILKEFPYAILVTNTEIMGYPPNAYLNKVVHSDPEWINLYKEVEPQRRMEHYEDKIERLKEHYKYSGSSQTEEEYVAEYITLYPFNRRSDFDEWRSENEWEILSLLDNTKITPESILAGVHRHVCIQYWGLDTLKFVNNGKLGVLFFIDEIHLELNSLESKNIDVSIMVEISQRETTKAHSRHISEVYTNGKTSKRADKRLCCV